MAEQTTILVVEDDEVAKEFLSDNLRADSYEVLTAESGKQAFSMLEARSCDLVLLDVILPDVSGYEFCRRLRESDGGSTRIDPELPIIMVSGRTSDADRVRGFARGADDYVSKPYSYQELESRIAAVLRRTTERRKSGKLRVAGLIVDPMAREVELQGKPIELSAKEFELLRRLATEPSRVFTKEELLREVWGYELMGSTRTLDSHASRLRRKLDSGSRRWIVNVWGVGYRLTDRI